jgi:hypothetical protein
VYWPYIIVGVLHLYSRTTIEHLASEVGHVVDSPFLQLIRIFIKEGINNCGLIDHSAQQRIFVLGCDLCDLKQKVEIMQSWLYLSDFN